MDPEEVPSYSAEVVFTTPLRLLPLLPWQGQYELRHTEGTLTE